MGNREKSYMNNKFKKSAPIWSGEFELPNGSNSVSDFQDYFEYTFTKKKHGEKDVNSPIGICLNKMENRIAFKIETRFYYVFLTSETRNYLEALKVR